MFAVIQTGAKQYRVSSGDKIRIEKIEGEVGTLIKFDDVLLLAKSDDEIKIGQPILEDVCVEGKILSQDKHKKVIVFKRKRRKGFHKKKGHRQPFTEVEISAINA